MLKEFTSHIDTEFSHLIGKKILVAISGGLDSVVLCHLLKSLNLKLELAHCNFHLRGEESDLDATFTANFAKNLNVQFHQKSFDTLTYAAEEKVSVQMAARELRYEWFNTLMINRELDYLMTAHHADDNLETFFINFVRGTGLDGLCGIPRKNGNLIRPLLPFSRKDLHEYALSHGLTWREDSSNTNDKYLRNKIRMNIIPILKELNPALLDTFNETISHLKDSRAIIDDQIPIVLNQITISEDGKLKINIQDLQSMSNPRIYLYEILKKYGFTAWNDVVNLLEAQSGKCIFSNSHQLLKDRNYLILTALEQSEEKIFWLPNVDSYFFNDFKLAISKADPKKMESEKSIAFVDAEKVEFPLHLRKWREGDSFSPLGMTGNKKLSDYFIDKKYSKNDKAAVWLLCDKHRIIWILNDRLDHNVRMTNKTKSVLKFEISPV